MGRCTLTATSRPSLSVPLYTCPIEAEASGRSESFAKTEERSATLSSERMIWRARSESKGGTASCSARSSSA